MGDSLALLGKYKDRARARQGVGAEEKEEFS
jgi:hypothetical protein